MEEFLRLPVSTQEFEVLRNCNMLYVDKTDIVYRMANAAENVIFFGRPRRFGKTIMLSTLEAYFQGRRELFEGLKIMELEKEWHKHEVLRFDWSGPCTAEGFDVQISNQLMRYEQQYGMTHIAPSIGTRFANLIAAAAKGLQNVVVLIDEYDYPLQHTLFHQEDEHEALKRIYRDFCAVLKSQSRYIKFICLTGITKFTGLSLFSVMNNIKVVSYRAEYEGLCGITNEELRGALLPYVAQLAEENEMTTEEAFAAIKQRYDGYHFSRRMTEIYNPYSLIGALQDRQLVDYWASSGNTQMLMDAVAEMGIDVNKLEGYWVDAADVEQSDITRSDLPLFLLQSGYLTIKEYDRDATMYALGIPNTEVRNAIYSALVPYAANQPDREVRSSIGMMRKCLLRRDVEGAMAWLRQLVAEAKYGRSREVKIVEENFQLFVEQVMWLVGCRTTVEKHVATGRIDILCEYKTCILVMELKMTARGGTEAAQEQLVTRRYADAFQAQPLPVYTIALAFNAETLRMEEPVVTQVK